MARKAFLLRLDPEVLAELQRWADEDLRSLNGQIEFVLREAITRRAGKRVKRSGDIQDAAKEAEGRNTKQSP